VNGHADACLIADLRVPRAYEAHDRPVVLLELDKRKILEILPTCRSSPSVQVTIHDPHVGPSLQPPCKIDQMYPEIE